MIDVLLIHIHSLYSFKYKNLNDEDTTEATDAYWELLLKIGGDGFAEIVGKDGRMLLHRAAGSHLSKNAIQRVIQLHPKAVMKVDVNNRLPLHWACYYNRRVAAESLAAAFPAALSIKDKDDKTPFELIGDGVTMTDDEMMIAYFKTGLTGIAVTDDEKLSFKRATLRAIMEAHCSNEAVLGYGNEKEVSVYIEYYFQFKMLCKIIFSNALT